MTRPILYLATEDDAPEQAAAWRLAGARGLTVTRGQETAALAQALHTAALVLLTPRLAARLPAAGLEDALASLWPLALVLPAHSLLPQEPAEQVRRQLGLEERGAEPMDEP